MSAAKWLPVFGMSMVLLGSGLSIWYGMTSQKTNENLDVTRGRARLKCDGTHAETGFGLSAKWMSPFKLAGGSVQSTTGSQGVRISGSNARYTML